LHATKRIATVFGALALTSTLAACGGVPKEVDADQPDQSNGSDAGGSAEESEGQQPDEPFDGSTATFSKISEDNMDGLCSELFGDVPSVLSSLDVNTADIDMDSYSDWTEDYHEQVGSTADTFSCYATTGSEGEDAESVRFNVASGKGQPGGVNDVEARSNDMSGGLSLQTSSDRPDDEVLSSFLKDEVLPKFKP
jgi:hypothetical protein